GGSRREQRQYHGDAAARGDRVRQPDLEVGPSRIHVRQQEYRRCRRDDAARNQDWTLPDPPRQLPEPRRDQEYDQRPRHKREPRPNRRIPPDVAEKLDVAEKHDREPRAVEELTEVRPTKLALGKEVEREHRIDGGGAPGDERAEHHQTAEKRSDGPGTRPSPLAGLNEREREENERDRDDDRSDGVGQPRTFRLARLIQQPRPEDRD